MGLPTSIDTHYALGSAEPRSIASESHCIFVRTTFVVVAYQVSLEPPEVASASRRRSVPELYLTRVLSDVHPATLAINSEPCPADEAPICKPLPEVKANVIHNTGRSS